MSVLRGGSLRARLTRTLVGLGLASVVLLATVNFFVVRELLERSTEHQLEGLRDSRADAIELAFDRLQVRASVLGSDPGVADALVALDESYGAIDTELTDAQVAELAAVYEPVVARYDDAGVERPPVDALLPASDAGRYLQYAYLASNPFDDRSELVDAADGSEYASVHAEQHEFLRGLAASVGASDLLLVDIDSGEVIYSVAKRVDLGTNVLDGPYADAGLGIAVEKLDGATAGDAVLSDVSFYLPDTSAPVLHVATAVRDDAEVVGALVLMLPTERLTDIVTASQNWDALGLGETGDAYVVGADLRIRTVPRSWFEDPDAYLERFRDVTGDGRAAGLIEFTGSPVLIQEADNAAVRTALDGEPFVGGVDNPLDRSSVAAAAPLAVGDLGWVLVTEQQTRETNAELMRFVVTILLLLAILLTVLTIVGLLLARVLARPVRPLVEAAGRIADGDYETVVPDLGRNELGDVGRQLEAVAAQLRDQEASIEAEEDRITTMLSTVLPDALVERVRSGERDLAEVVDTATVVAFAVSGVPSPTSGEQDAVVELTTRLTSEIGRLAHEHRVERAQVALQHQMFVAGRGRTGTDADLAAAFAVDVIAAVRDVGADHGLELAARAGLSAGLVATGVIGTRQVSFTIWGAPVTAAIRLSALAEDGCVLVDDTVADDLGDGWSALAATESPDVHRLERAPSTVDDGRDGTATEGAVPR